MSILINCLTKVLVRGFSDQKVEMENMTAFFAVEVFI
jgi:hypothetical protein